ncbi:hypothetical protein YC2023_060236 [Brassica napus]
MAITLSAVITKLPKARKVGILDMSPKDEVEGELLYYQLQFWHRSFKKANPTQLPKSCLWRLMKSMDEDGMMFWEARKQGRKEKRHKEAQAVLAAATAAAETSSRNTSLMKDMTEEPACSYGIQLIGMMNFKMVCRLSKSPLARCLLLPSYSASVRDALIALILWALSPKAEYAGLGVISSKPSTTDHLSRLA